LSTALFIFANTAKVESVKKNFSKEASKNYAIASSLLNHTVDICQQSGIDYYLISSEQQEGSDFGTRFSNAFQSIFSKGYERVIAIGSDCPMLTTKILQQAAQQLETENVVLGPAIDGGVYLIGLDKKHFDIEALRSLTWQNSQVFKQLVDYAANYSKVFCLPTLSDVDDNHDLSNLVGKNCSNSIIRLLRSLLFSLVDRIYFSINRFITLFPPFSFGLKAPPIHFIVLR
jgi:uncharacterized protein